MVLLVCKTSDFWIKSEFSLGLNSLGCRFYPFIPWSILCHSLLACQVSAEKTWSPYGSCLVCNLSCLSFAAFNIRFNFCLIEIAVFLGVFSLGWSSLGLGGHSPPVQFSSVHFSRSVVSDSLWPHESQHTRPPCPSQTPGVYSDSCPSSQWYHPAISSSVIPFFSCPQSLPASGSFPMSQLFTWGGQSIGVSASTSVLPMNTQDWSPLGWTG